MNGDFDEVATLAAGFLNVTPGRLGVRLTVR